MEVKKDPRVGSLKLKSFQLAIRIVKLCQFLVTERKEYILSKQLLRSGTNPGAMVTESENAESGNDFIHKLGIAQKELAETEYWLRLLLATGYLTEKEFNSMHQDVTEVMKLTRSSIITRRKNLQKSKTINT